jgi:hypothetical protein
VVARPSFFFIIIIITKKVSFHTKKNKLVLHVYYLFI